MTIQEAIQQRHSVRSYTDKRIDGETRTLLEDFIAKTNNESGLHFQLVTDEPEAFDSKMAHYGSFRNVRNYIVCAGPKGKDLDERIGYYGEDIVLFAQALGLNTCWVALTYSRKKTKVSLKDGEKLSLVIAIGYGETEGKAHTSKAREAVMKAENPPAWFLSGIDAALLAPTAVNQQKFTFTLDGDRVSAKAGLGFYAKIDLGIAKRHFAIGAGEENFSWT